MERHEVMNRLLKAAGISDSQVDLTEKVLSLEEDTERVHSVNLYHATIGYSGLSAQILLLKDFQGENDFRTYLKSKGLPTKRTWKKDREYKLNAEGVLIEFLFSEHYAKKKQNS